MRESSSDMQTYLFVYQYNGQEYNFEIDARSEADACLRLNNLSHSAVYIGRRVGEPIYGTGIGAALRRWLRERRR